MLTDPKVNFVGMKLAYSVCDFEKDKKNGTNCHTV